MSAENVEFPVTMKGRLASEKVRIPKGYKKAAVNLVAVIEREERTGSSSGYTATACIFEFEGKNYECCIAPGVFAPAVLGKMLLQYFNLCPNGNRSVIFDSVPVDDHEINWDNEGRITLHSVKMKIKIYTSKTTGGLYVRPIMVKIPIFVDDEEILFSPQKGDHWSFEGMKKACAEYQGDQENLEFSNFRPDGDLWEINQHELTDPMDLMFAMKFGGGFRC